MFSIILNKTLSYVYKLNYIFLKNNIMCQKIHINLQNIQECMYINENNLLTNLNISRESYGCT